MNTYLSLAQNRTELVLLVVAGLILAAIAIFALMPRLASTRLGPWACYQIACLHARFIAHWRSENACPIPEDGPAIIVANHTSPADPVILWVRHFAGFRKPRLRVIGYLTAKEYCEQRGPIGWICRAMQSIPVGRTGRDMAPVKAALDRIREGHLMGLFPEGRLNTKTPDKKLIRPSTGVAWLALKSQAPVIPIYIRNAPRSDNMLKCFIKRTQTTVIYGKPLDLSKWLSERPTRGLLVEVTNHIMSELAKLGGVDFTPLSADSAEEQVDDEELSHEHDLSKRNSG